MHEGKLLRERLQAGSLCLGTFNTSSDPCITELLCGSGYEFLVIDAEHPGKLTQSTQPYDRRVAGIVAGAEGLGSTVRIGAQGFDFDVALAGRVYCLVDATRFGVQPGDLLTTSATPGHAMKVTDPDRAPGAVLGKAMEPLEQGTAPLCVATRGVVANDIVVGFVDFETTWQFL